MKKGIDALAISPDSQYIATTTSDSAVQIWQLGDNGYTRRIFIQPQAESVQIAFSPNSQSLLLLPQQPWEEEDAGLWEWDVQTGQKIKQWVTAAEIPYAFTVSPTGTYLATEDGMAMQIWDFTSGEEVERVTGGVYSLAFSSDDELLAFSDVDGVHIWPFRQPEGQSITVADEWMRRLTFSPDGQMLAGSHTLNEESLMRIWSVTDGSELAHITHDDMILDAVFSPTSGYVASSSADGTAVLWGIVPPWDGLYADLGVSSFVDDAAFSTDGQLVAAASQSGEIVLWSLASEQEMIRFKGEDGGVSQLLFSPDDRYLAVAWSQSLHLFDTTTGVEIGPIPYPQSEDHYLRHITFSPDSRYLATASDDQTVRLYDVTSGQPEKDLLFETAVMSVVFSPDSETMITTQVDGLIQLWDLPTYQSTQQLSTLSDGYGPTALISNDGDWFDFFVDGQAQVWRMDDLSFWFEVKDTASTPNIYEALFSPDGRFFVTSGNGRTVRIWDIAAQKEIYRWQLPNVGRELSISQDGRYLVAQVDRTTHIWDMETAQEVAAVPHNHTAIAAVLSPDNRLLLSGSQLWLWQPDDLLTPLCERLTRNLTLAEWETYLRDEPYRQSCDMLP